MEIIKDLKNVWFIILFIGTAIASWTTFSNRLDNIEIRVDSVEEKQGTFDPKITQIQVDIASIKTALEILTNQ